MDTNQCNEERDNDLYGSCKHCEGTGDLVHLTPGDPTSGRYLACPVCKGTGHYIFGEYLR